MFVPPTCRQAERCGNPVSYSERQTYESHQWSEETVSQLQPLQHFNASLRCQHRPRGRARQGLAVCLFFSDSHKISLTDQSLLSLTLLSEHWKICFFILITQDKKRFRGRRKVESFLVYSFIEIFSFSQCWGSVFVPCFLVSLIYCQGSFSVTIRLKWEASCWTCVW